MSKAVSPTELHSAAEPYGPTPFLLYSNDGSVRVNHVVAHAMPESDQVTVSGFGKGLASRLNPELHISLLWPPHTQGGLSLIADATGRLQDDDTIVLTVSQAVLHRPAPLDGPTSC